MKSLIVTDGSDVDGIISSALLRRFYGFEAELVFCTYPEQERIFRQIAEAAPGKKIYISDISAKDFRLNGGKKTVLEYLAVRAEGLEWYDHHPATRDFISLFEKHGHKIIMGDREKICAAGLIQSRRLSGDWYAGFLAGIAQAHDYPPAKSSMDTFVKAGAGLQKIISYFNSRNDAKSLADLINLIAQDHFWYQRGEFKPRLKEIIFAAEEQIERARAGALKNCVFLNVKGKSFVIACAEAILPQKESLVELRDEFAGKIDGVAIYFLPPVGHLLFYQGARSNFNAQKFCEFLGGGGRDGNGGFSPPTKFSQEEFGVFVDFLAKKLGEFIN